MSINYTQATLCYPIQNNQVLLEKKQKKLGAGFLNGFGGKTEPGDLDIFFTNARETEEEIGIKIKTAKKMGEIAFNNPSDDNELKNMMVHIFVATEWTGLPKDTDEMKKIKWYEIANLDYDKFLPADRLFLPQILNGICLRGLIEYNPD